MEVVNAFQADPEPCVFLLSLRAAGTGLNLTNASYVVLYDPWWNPAVEAQASDRAWRMGQTQAVTVYRLLARRTIEETIHSIHQEKKHLANSLLEGKDPLQVLDWQSIWPVFFQKDQNKQAPRH